LLISQVEGRTDPVLPDGRPIDRSWHLMTYEFRLKPGLQAAPRPMVPAAD